jgi:hypothetical protein
MNGLSYAEVARHLDTNVTTIKGRLQRARVRLREAVEMVEKELAQEGLPEDFSEEIRQLLDGLETSEAAREEALGRLANIGKDAVMPLAEALQDDRAWVRHVAVRALCVLGNGRTLKPLLRLLYGQRELPHMHEREILAMPGMREALLDLIKRHAWNKDDRDDRKNWAGFFALSGAEGDQEMFDCVVEVFRDADEHWSIRYFALTALVGIKPTAATALVMEGLAAAEAPLVDRALRIAARNGLELPLSAYERVLERPDWPHFRGLLDKVLAFGDAGIRLAEAQAKSDHPTERMVALQALAGIGTTAASVRLEEDLLGSQQQAHDADLWKDPFLVRDLL